jgi:hypothetical protein
MVFIISMVGGACFIGGGVLAYIGLNGGSAIFTVIGAILVVVGFGLLGYAGFANQNQMIDRLRNGR